MKVTKFVDMREMIGFFTDFTNILRIFNIFHRQVTRTYFTGAWGRVGRPHCVRTSFRDLSRGLSEQNRLATRILASAGSPLRHEGDEIC